MPVKQPKVRVTYEEKFKKNVPINIKVVTDICDQNPGKVSAEILAQGKMSDGTEFVTIKILIAP